MDLTQEQAEVLGNFMAITGIDDRLLAVQILTSLNWHLEEAVFAFQPDIAPPRQAPAVQPASNSGGLLGSLKNLFSVDTGAADPNQQTLDFIREYETVFGRDHPEFFANSYARALDKAKRDLLFLLIYLHSPEHDETNSFCRNTLNSLELSGFLVERSFLIWGGNVQKSDAFAASSLLQAAEFPFLALVCLKDSRMQVVHRIEGADKPCEHIIAELADAIDNHGQNLIVARADRQERQVNRTILQEQDDAYQQSLRRDREKERLRREAEERERKEIEERLKKEAEKELAKKRRESEREQLKTLFVQEPSDTTPDVTKIVFRLPDGTRVTRRFLAHDKVQTLYQFASTRDLHIESEEFAICSNFPRKLFDNKDLTLKEAGLVPNGMVVVEEIYASNHQH